MNIHIICIGKLKEQYLREAVAEYTKRLQRFIKITFIECPEEKGNEPLHSSQIEQIINKEGKRIIDAIPAHSYSIALDIQGKNPTSIQFSRELDELTTYGISHISFLIGGSYGLSKEVKHHAKKLLSLSHLTFPHQIAKVLLLEQIYRACKINHGESYHK